MEFAPIVYWCIFYTEMRVFFNSNTHKVYKENFVVYYFQYLHKAIKTSYFRSEILDLILRNDSGVNIKDIDFSMFTNNISVVENFVKFLIDNKIIFLSETDLIQASFENIYKNILKYQYKKVYIHLTQRCNLRCSYCYNRHNINSGRVELGLEAWIDNISKLSELGYKDIIITGGEPFLYEDLPELVRNIKSSDNHITVLTNGTLLNTRNASLTIDYVDNIIVSLDALNVELNSLKRLNSEKYDIIYNLIKNVDKSKLCVRAVVSKNNYAEINKFRDFVINNLRCKFITVNLIPNSINELEEFCPTFSNDDMKQTYSIYDIAKCGAGNSIIALDSNGDIYPCQTLINDKFKIGNILIDDVKDKINDFIDSDTILPITKIEPCSNCVFKYICGGGCKAITYNLQRELNNKNHFLCNAYKERAKRFIYGLF